MTSPPRHRVVLAPAALAVIALAGCGGASAPPAPIDPPAAHEGDEAPIVAEAPAPAEDEAPLDPDAPPPAARAALEGAQLDEARARFSEGMRAYAANDFARAASLLAEVDRAMPSPELAYNLGYCHQRLADPDGAIAYYRRYLETGGPSERERADVEARVERMEQLRARQRDITMTLPPSMDALAADAAALFASGQEMFRRRRYAPALQAFSAAAAAFRAISAEVPELVYNLAVTSERMRSLDDAADYYEEYLRLRPLDPEADRLRAHVAELRGRRRR